MLIRPRNENVFYSTAILDDAGIIVALLNTYCRTCNNM